jgi:inhibitor of cysteine peptidase
MERILKAITILLVVAAIIFVAGCAEKTSTTENQNQAASGQVTPVSAVTPAETPTPAVTPVVTDKNVTENATGNYSNQTVTHISNTVRKKEIATSHTLSSGTQIVKQ